MGGNKKQKLKVGTSLFLCLLNLLFMHHYIIQTCQVEDVIEWTSWVDNFCRLCFDVWVVFSFLFFFLKRSVKWSLCFTFCITLVWSFSNIVYSRFFYHYLSLSSLGETGALIDPLVLNSVVSGLRWTDLYFILMPIPFFLLFRHASIKIASRSYLKWSGIVFSSLFFLNLSAHLLFCSLDPSLRYITYYERRVGMRLFGQNHLLALPIYANFHNGSIKSIVIEAVLDMQGHVELTAKQVSVIENELIKSKNSIVRNRGVGVRNVIFILVESYMSFVSDLKVDGREVTPFLNSLKQDTSVYYNGNIHSNITMGESSDGQFILMTGMLPLRSMITVSKVHKKPLPSLVKSLEAIGIKESRMILPTSSSLWRQDDMCKQYGFTYLFASNEYQGMHEQTLTDKQVFELAVEKDRQMSKNLFFSMILTATMHQPYNKIVDSTFVLKNDSLSSEMISYLNVCHYTDDCIGNYLNTLKKSGLYDSSLIIITADHHVHNAGFVNEVSSDIPLFIVNGDIDSDAYRGECNQIDIYTTILDVLGIKDEWPGLGFSILNETYNYSDISHKWHVSEMLILGDYFRDSP